MRSNALIQNKRMRRSGGSGLTKRGLWAGRETEPQKRTSAGESAGGSKKINFPIAKNVILW